jgi:hypothetical protein
MAWLAPPGLTMTALMVVIAVSPFVWPVEHRALPE